MLRMASADIGSGCGGSGATGVSAALTLSGSAARKNNLKLLIATADGDFPLFINHSRWFVVKFCQFVSTIVVNFITACWSDAFGIFRGQSCL